MGGGHDKPAWTACAPHPRGEDNQGGGVRYLGTACPPGGKLSRGHYKLGHWFLDTWIQPHK